MYYGLFFTHKYYEKEILTMSKKEVNQEEVQETPKKKGGKGKTILIVIVVLIIIGAIGSMNKKDSESSGSSSSESKASSSAESKESSAESNKSTVDVNDAEAVKAAFKAGDFSMVSEDVKKLVDEIEKASDDNMNAVKGKQTSEFVNDPVYQESLEIVTKNTIQLDLALGKSKNPADKLYKEFVYERLNEKRTANGFEAIN